MNQNSSVESETAEFQRKDDDKTEYLAKQIGILQIEKKQIEEEFGMQRAKMKELYLQKENEFKQQLVDREESLKSRIKTLQTELDECRSQLTVTSLEFQSKLEGETRKYQEELSSLQHLLSETVEEAAKYENEIKRLNYINSRLLADINDLKSSSSGSGSSVGADMPQILSVPGTVISSIARKVTSQITTQLSSTDSSNNSSSGGGTTSISSVNSIAPVATLSQFLDTDTLDDSMRKAQEDAAVLRSLVVPLEEEIKALKDKLREMDVELRKYQKNNNNNNSASFLDDDAKGVIVAKMIDIEDHETQETVTTMEASNVTFLDNTTAENMSHSSASCDMCSNYEAQLVNAQQKIHDLEKHIISLERYKQELSKETAFRKDMEQKWSEKKEEYKEQVKALQSKTEKAEETIKELRSTFANTYDDVTQQLEKLCLDRENNQKELNRLQRENNSLVGKYNKHSQQLQNEVINLPNNVEDLQELILRNQEELISAKIAKERADELVASLTEEMTILREQSQNEEQARIELENTLTENMNKLRNDLQLISQERNHHMEAYQGADRDNVSLRQEMQQFSSKIDKLTKSKKHFEEVVTELRSRVSSLQTELDNSEKVQKDFVLLSQSLQQELEKIRGAETEVRWEHEEDVVECRRCKNTFSSVTRRKVHCRHCGRIFCSSCLTRTVNSGPNNRPSKVCDVCHTLLVRDSAPYFSTVPPQCD